MIVVGNCLHQRTQAHFCSQQLSTADILDTWGNWSGEEEVTTKT